MKKQSGRQAPAAIVRAVALLKARVTEIDALVGLIEDLAAGQGKMEAGRSLKAPSRARPN